MIQITTNSIRNTECLLRTILKRSQSRRVAGSSHGLHLSQHISAAAPTTNNGIPVTGSPTESPILLDQLNRIASHQHCVKQVMKYDRENYLAALCIKDNRLKRIVFALRAFNVELALVRDMTTNSDRAKIRFHFWSKLIEEIINRNEQTSPDLDKDIAYYKHTPVAKELLDIFHLVNIDTTIEQYLKDLVGARVSSKVLGYKPFDTLSELELYCTKSNSSLYQLAWRLDHQLHNLWKPRHGLEPEFEKVSYELGIAQGLSNIIRGVPYNSTRNCCYIPKTILEQHQLTNRDFVTKQLDGVKVMPAIKTIATRCQELMNSVHRSMRPMPNHFRHIYLPRVAIQSNLNILKKCNYNICDPRVSKRNELLPLSLKLSSIYFRAPIL